MWLFLKWWLNIKLLCIFLKKMINKYFGVTGIINYLCEVVELIIQKKFAVK